MATNQITYPHWIEISRSQLLANLELIKKQVGPSVKIMGMVKANAYGHGLTLVAPTIAPFVDFLGVHTLEDALTLSKLHLQPKIFIDSPIELSSLTKIPKSSFSICVPTLSYLSSLTNSPLSIHLKINTGMNRLGLALGDLEPALKLLQHSSLRVEGVYTHFHSSDTSRSSTLSQIKIFQHAAQIIKHYYPTALAHTANTSAIFNYPQSHFDLVRPGLALYGYGHPNLFPVLTWKSSLVQSRLLATNSSVGYSATYFAKNPHYMGVLPLGYSDGYDRKLSNTGRVWASSRYFPVIGRISMNFTTINLGDNLLNLPSSFEILGPHITADELATLTQSINYEILSRLNPLIPRQLV